MRVFLLVVILSWVSVSSCFSSQGNDSDTSFNTHEIVDKLFYDTYRKFGKSLRLVSTLSACEKENLSQLMSGTVSSEVIGNFNIDLIYGKYNDYFKKFNKTDDEIAEIIVIVNEKLNGYRIGTYEVLKYLMETDMKDQICNAAIATFGEIYTPEK